jgi:hypothetical protein
MIKKSELKGKYVSYMKDGKFFTRKVVRISGSYVSVQSVLKGKPSRIHKSQIYGRQLPKRGLEDIDWSRGA